MIANAIILFLKLLLDFVIGLIPNVDFISNMVIAKNGFIEFLAEFISYSLYLFNVPVLKLSFTILVGYITFLSAEYTIKLIIKYVTRLL